WPDGSFESDVWPAVLVFLAVLIPALGLLWFMAEAMRNERLAARQRLVEAYGNLLSSAQTRLHRAWTEQSARLEELARISPPATAFFQCVQSGAVDSVLIFDQAGHVLYPDAPAAPQTSAKEEDPQWARASQLEYQRRDFLAGARAYDALANAATNANTAAR